MHALQACPHSPSTPQACLYSLLAYNNCLGQAITAAEDALEDKQAQEAQHNQVGAAESQTAMLHVVVALCCWLHWCNFESGPSVSFELLPSALPSRLLVAGV